jgi:hypothetical protein
MILTLISTMMDGEVMVDIPREFLSHILGLHVTVVTFELTYSYVTFYEYSLCTFSRT